MKQRMITACVVTLSIVVNMHAGSTGNAADTKHNAAIASAVAFTAQATARASSAATASAPASALRPATPAPTTSVRVSGSAPTPATAQYQRCAASSVAKNDPRLPKLIGELQTGSYEAAARCILEDSDKITALTAQLGAVQTAAQKSAQESKQRYAAMLAAESQLAHGEIARLEQEKRTHIKALQKEHADALQSLTNKHITYASLGALAIIAWFKRDTIIKWYQQGKEKISAYVKTYTATRDGVKQAS